MQLVVPDRHGIGHGCMDIIHVRFHFPWVKYPYGNTLYALNSLPIALLCLLGNFFGGQKKNLKNLLNSFNPKCLSLGS